MTHYTSKGADFDQFDEKAYTLSTGVKFITEADRSVTTFLLPDEY